MGRSFYFFEIRTGDNRHIQQIHIDIHTPILKTLGQFENLMFVIMSTRENIHLIA